MRIASACCAFLLSFVLFKMASALSVSLNRCASYEPGKLSTLMS